ncbi:MAG: TraC family protein [Nitrospinae bacterium]|nr:TraC family protein [Nitrospinota bacterium]
MKALKGTAARIIERLTGAPTRTGLLDMARRDRFSEYLPYRVYRPETMAFHNLDNTLGFIWKCHPAYFMDDKGSDSLARLLSMDFPENTVMQFILHANPFIRPILDEYKGLCAVHDNPVLRRTMDEYCRFLEDSTGGMKRMSKIPVRDFQLYVTLKFPIPSKSKNARVTQVMLDQRNGAEDILRSCGLAPRYLDAEGLINWQGRILNKEICLPRLTYDPHEEIHRQIIKGGSVIRKHWNRLEIAQNTWKCLSPKKLPKEVDILQSKQVIGGIWGPSSDIAQITQPFVYTVNFVFKSLKMEIEAKNWLVSRKEFYKGKEQTQAREKAEHATASDKLEQGEKFLLVMPLLWIYGEDPHMVDSAVSNAANVIFAGQGYEMQKDWGLLDSLFLAAMPFGLYTDEGNLEVIDRHHTVTAEAAARLSPVQGGYAGGGNAVNLLVDRTGQIIRLDYWDKAAASNHNGLICASAGKGKSYLLNYIVMRLLETGVIVRGIDIGRSGEKLAKILKARVMRFHDKSDICIPPFSLVKRHDEGNPDDEDYLPSDMGATSQIFMNMVYSSSPADAWRKEESQIMKEAVTWAYDKAGEEATVDMVQEFLYGFPRFSPELKDRGSSSVVKGMAEMATILAYSLRDFSSKGVFGRWVNGKSNVDLMNDQYIYMELEELFAAEELFRVIYPMTMDYVSKTFYLGDRSVRKFMYQDEAHLALKKAGRIADLFEQAYRRFRKHNAGQNIITQSVLDLISFAGDVGRVIWNNSDKKMLLQSEDFDSARNGANPIITYDDFTMELLKSVRTEQGRYSEIFFHTSRGTGVARLCVPRYMHYLNSSQPDEVAEIDSIMDEIRRGVDSKQFMHGYNDGMAGNELEFEQVVYDLAIMEMIRRHGN